MADELVYPGPRGEQDGHHDGEARGQGRVVERHRTQQERDDQGDLGGETGVILTAPPVTDERCEPDETHPHREHQPVVELRTQAAEERDQRECAHPLRPSSGPLAFRTLPLDPHHEADAERHRKTPMPTKRGFLDGGAHASASRRVSGPGGGRCVVDAPGMG